MARLVLASLGLLTLCMPFGAFPAALAQSGDHPGRKVIRSETPTYPAILKILRIGGTVRLNAKVLANGTVANVSILGGNPIFAESAAKAVMNWKYAPGAATSNEVVVLDFNPK